MNRLVIIGNGFDLAHGLPTSYKDFIDDYWKNINNTCYEDDFIKLNIDEIGSYDGINSYSNLVDILNNYFIKYGNVWKVKMEENEFFLYKPLRTTMSKTSLLKFKNDFFRILNQQMNVKNWVDIENIYYEILKSKTKEEPGKYLYYGNVGKLNKEFNQVQNLLEKYLEEKVLAKYHFEHFSGENQDWLKIHEKLKPISLLSNEENILKEFSNLSDRNKIEVNFLEEKNRVIVNKLYFLNFNYTPTIVKYSGIVQNDRIETNVNFIHGKLSNKEDPINFGFGDEMDDDYRFIENINNNEYLRNFKSFQYLQNSNYNDLLSYIDSDKFQVYIMGHSCGLSDRTLLNTVFEHNNCRSIKVFYHLKKDGTDNYTEIIQNISRHFNKKALMREKIVNKTLCQPLPQIQLPLK
ncbi:AbiH family protein [Flavobacterium laiguense]|uniref:Bacteriophage abortive infection AbiH n=1 Tax=Flavobacterium laiguense TaxID=2169409 RepID=A0A2U1K1K0_9FLAO|nr:AbiH family protein [Flavobacterium laiguense]PWA11386.1 hypothetical protein DB891_00800 [Flavobacterium laiguense]